MKFCNRPVKSLQNSRGVALLATIAIITVLIAVAIELNRKVRSAVMATGTSRDRVTLSQMSASGVNVAMAVLVKDKNSSPADSIQEQWADPKALETIVRAIPFSEGNIKIHISDERAKIQVNALVQYPGANQYNPVQQILWLQFLNLLLPQYELEEDIEATAIINAVKDWIDTNDDDAITGLNGAESDYYKGLERPYSCRNGPVPHLTELMLIKGITADLYYGVHEIAGISEFITTHGLAYAQAKGAAYDGKININTVPRELLAALLPPGSRELAAMIDDYRMEILDDKFMHDLSQPTWYKNVPGLSGITIDPDLITTVSDVFKIKSMAALRDLKLTSTAIVKREKNPESGKWFCRVLQWETG